LSPLLFALLALDMGGTARDLARNVAALLAHDSVILAVRNQSTLSPGEAVEIRRAFESELRAGGARLAAAPPAAELQLTLSENLTEFLLVAELRRGGQRDVLMDSWPRAPLLSPTPVAGAPAPVTIEKKLLWEQEQPILDVARLDDGVLVLDPARILLFRGPQRQSVPIVPPHAWPRDLRGRLATAGAEFTAWLPGLACRGVTQPHLSAECRESQQPWPVAPGATAALAPARNFFEGRVTIDSWGSRDLPAFYSAAQVGDTWVFAGIDGRARLYTRSWEARGVLDQWGADLAGVATTCGPRILSTRPAAITEPDAIQPFQIVEGAANPAGPPLDFPGPVTALWSNGSSAIAVSHDPRTKRYAAFSLAPACGN